MIGTSYEDGELPFQKRVAQKLMVVARDPWFEKRLNETLLPPIIIPSVLLQLYVSASLRRLINGLRTARSRRHSSGMRSARRREVLSFHIATNGARLMERALDALAMPPVGDDRGYRDLLAELQERSLTLQPRSPFEFSQYSVAVHESGHLVVAAHEGHQLKATRIYRDGRNGWSGDARYEYRWVNRAAELRIVLAGRRSERLFFGEHFCLRSGLDELAAAMLATSGDSEVLTREIAEIDEISIRKLRDRRGDRGATAVRRRDQGTRTRATRGRGAAA